MATFGITGNMSPYIFGELGEAVTSGAYLAVKFNSSGKIVKCAANDVPIGILVGQTPSSLASGDEVTVQIMGVAPISAGGTFAAGDGISIDANGKAVKATAGATAVVNVVGKALGAGASGKVVDVLLDAFTLPKTA